MFTEEVDGSDPLMVTEISLLMVPAMYQHLQVGSRSLRSAGMYEPSLNRTKPPAEEVLPMMNAPRLVSSPLVVNMVLPVTTP